MSALLHAFRVWRHALFLAKTEFQVNSVRVVWGKYWQWMVLYVRLNEWWDNLDMQLKRPWCVWCEPIHDLLGRNETKSKSDICSIEPLTIILTNSDFTLDWNWNSGLKDWWNSDQPKIATRCSFREDLVDLALRKVSMKFFILFYAF